MPEKAANTVGAWEIELAISRVDRLCVSAGIASQLLSGLFGLTLTPGELTELVESDPALTAMIFSLAHQKGISFSDEKPSIAAAIGKLELREIRDEFLSSKIYCSADQQKSAFRKQLVIFSNAVAHYAKEIAELIQSEVEPELAYAAGLLHNIGNLALEETMPRSFTRIVDQAEKEKRNICQVQRENLGLDYTILGKRLAAKWHLPEQITLAIWLHQSDTKAITSEMPQAKITQIVRLAYLLSRQFGIGDSGSYDAIEPVQAIAVSLGIQAEQLEQIHLRLEEKISQKSKMLGMDQQDDLAQYCKNINNAAAHLAKETSKQAQENKRLQTKASHFDFTTEFLTSLNPASTPIELAQTFAVQWKKFYQTGKVCIYLTPTQLKNKTKAVIVENDRQSRIIFLKIPSEIPAIQNDFAILNAAENCQWLFEQIDTDFDTKHTKMIPILSSNGPAGAILFEFYYPVETKQLQEMFKATSFIAGALFEMSFRLKKQQTFAEGFARCIKKKAEVVEKPEIVEKEEPQRTDTNDYIAVLTEMAAGAAHELNNPLSVISGRSQLLVKAEDDPQKKEILKQIRDNAGQLAKIIEDLMGFAEPAPPRKSAISVKQVLEEALQLTSQKTGVEHINAQMEIDDNIPETIVDSAQIVSAIASILSNSLESYSDQSGPIKITATVEDAFIKLQISDLGSGMDEQTIKKATYPFFSAKPAGRKRGMGLANAARLIQLNSGSLDITSQTGSGTTTTITLPTG